MTELATTEAATDEPQGELYRTFTDQPIALIGSPTDDRRLIAEDVDLSYREFPLPFMWCEKAVPGHGDAYTVGVLESARIEGGFMLGSGYLLNTEEADKAALQNTHGVSNPSVDLAATEYTYVDDDGNDIEDSDAFWSYLEEHGKMPVTKITAAKLIGCTLVSTPAFDTRLSLNDERESRDVALIASLNVEVSLPVFDPELFSDPKLSEPTRPTMNMETGRIYGHLAEWGTTVRGAHQPAPRNHNDYANFHTSQVMLSNGRQLSVGRLTVQGGHASTAPSVTVATARAHYDNVCTAYGLVRVGEDQHGIWFSGVPAPGVDPAVFQQGMTAPISGDWRDCGWGLDMIAAHAVNSPGIPIFRGATGPDGKEVALVASFAPVRRREQPMTAGDIVAAVSAGVTDAFQRAEQARQDSALRATRKAAMARAEKLVGKPPTVRERIGAMLAARKVV